MKNCKIETILVKKGTVSIGYDVVLTDTLTDDVVIFRFDFDDPVLNFIQLLNQSDVEMFVDLPTSGPRG